MIRRALWKPIYKKYVLAERQALSEVSKCIGISKTKKHMCTINKRQMQMFNQVEGWWKPNSSMSMLFQYNYKRVNMLLQYLENQEKAKMQKMKCISDQNDIVYLKAQTDANQNELNSLFPNNSNHARHNLSFTSDSAMPLIGLNILDVGCGAGFLSESMARLGATVTALDPNITSYRQAMGHKEARQDLQSLNYYNKSIQEWQSEDKVGRYDIVSSMQVLQHVDNPSSFIGSLSRMLRMDGILMLSTIQRSYKTWLTHILAAEYIFRLVPKGTHDYNKFITQNQCKDMLTLYGLKIQTLKSFYVNCKGQFVQGNGSNYIVIAKKIM